MPSKSNIIGDRLEELVKLGVYGRRVLASGAGKFFKLDVTDKLRFVISCKATEKDRITITKEHILEAQKAARGARGTGDGYKPALAIGLGIGTDDEVVGILTLLPDWTEVQTAPPSGRPNEAGKGEQRLRRALASPLDR